MRSRQLETSLTAFLEEAATHLGADTAAGAEVSFEVVATPSRAHRTPLYCYRPLTGAFLRDRAPTLESLPTHGAAVQALGTLEGLERYLLARGTVQIPSERGEQARAALRALLDDVFEEQTEFALRPDRVADALRRLEESAVAGTDQVTVLATLSGLAMSSPELALAGGLTIAQPDALRGVPPEAIEGPPESAGAHLLVALNLDELDPTLAALHGREVLRDLLRGLRLFGDGRMTLGTLGWTRLGAGNWRPLAIGSGGRPHGMLVITPEQEDELRAFCSLVSRRAPDGNEIAWALERYEMGCDRADDLQALTDHLLALRALLEPEGPSSGLLPGRLAALCAVPERRGALAVRVAQAVALEQAVVAGAGDTQAGDDALVRSIADHLRALLRDVICGHLDVDLVGVADEILAEEAAQAEAGADAEQDATSERQAARLPWDEEPPPGALFKASATAPDAPAEAATADPTASSFQDMLPF